MTVHSKKRNLHVCGFQPVWTGFENAECEIMQKENSGDKKKNMLPDLACHAALCTVLNNKQLLSVLTDCVWVMALLNPTLNHRIVSGKGEKTEWESVCERESRGKDWGTLTEGALALLRDCINRWAEKRKNKVHVYVKSVHDSDLAVSWQSGYLILPAFKDVVPANLTSLILCHHTQGAIGNLYKAGHSHTRTQPYVYTLMQKHQYAHTDTHSYTNIILLSCCAEMVLKCPSGSVTVCQSVKLIPPRLTCKWVSVNLQGHDRLIGSVSHSVRQM